MSTTTWTGCRESAGACKRPPASRRTWPALVFGSITLLAAAAIAAAVAQLGLAVALGIGSVVLAGEGLLRASRTE